MRFDLIIFDWDGTLMNSVPKIVSCMQSAAREAGCEPLPVAAIENIIGLGLPEAVRTLWPSIDEPTSSRLRASYSRHFVSVDTTPMPFFAGVEAHLDLLHAMPGVSLAVATGKTRRGLDRIFNETGSGRWFSASRTADETRSKPHPQMLEELLAECRVSVDRALMIGDTEYDLEMARTIGMPSVGVGYGVHSLPRLQACDPEYLASDVDALFGWLTLNMAG